LKPLSEEISQTKLSSANPVDINLAKQCTKNLQSFHRRLSAACLAIGTNRNVVEIFSTTLLSTRKFDFVNFS